MLQSSVLALFRTLVRVCSLRRTCSVTVSLPIGNVTFCFFFPVNCLAIIAVCEVDDDSEPSDSSGERCKRCLSIKLVNKPRGIERGCQEMLRAKGVGTS
jgi:hypothetical protein